MTEQKTVFQAVSDVMNDVKAVGKDGFNSHQKFNFRGIDGVMNAVGPALRDHGVIAVPMVEEAQYGTVQTNRGGNMSTVRVKMRVRWYGPAGDYFDSVTYGEAFDSGDKATAKAHSVAFRTAFLQTLCLPTQEPDPDEDTYQRASQQELEQQQRERAQQEEKAKRVYLQQQYDRVLVAEKNGEVETVKRAIEWASTNPELGKFKANVVKVLERMEAAGLVQDELGGKAVQGEPVNA